MTEERPSVLIVGGFATAPPNYWPLRRRLEQRGAARVDIAPIWPPDWFVAGMLGFGSLMRRTARAIGRTYRAGGRRPIIVVAHSGGGIATRLAMADAPFHGRVGGVAEAVGCLVTLGTPHGLPQMQNRYHHAGHEACRFLDREAPGAYFAPRTGYLSVASRATLPAHSGVVGAIVDDFFELIIGDQAAGLGDGIVPAAIAHLDGARQINLDEVWHGIVGAPWYGDDVVIDRWWPDALELWHAALAHRRSEAAAAAGEQDHPARPGRTNGQADRPTDSLLAAGA